ncbi:hypothetical protein ACFE04_030712 [Oxalis oulophora]
MATQILRRFSFFPRRVLPTLTSSSIHNLSISNRRTISTTLSKPLSYFNNNNVKGRSFYSKSGPIAFQATETVNGNGGGYAAVAEYPLSDEDKVVTKGDDEGLEIAKLGISNEIVNALAKKGIHKLFPIQKAVLEPAMQGRDMFGRARTGTGKTLAFGIPIMDTILRHNAKNGAGRYPMALVMAPTRELAKQVEKEFHEASNLETLCVYGQTPISTQINKLNYGVDVVVGTPGRLIDLLKRGALNLSHIKFVVLDEADQMLDVGFAESVEEILSQLPKQRQSMMFSATLPKWIKDLTRKYLNNPLTIDLVGDSNQKLADGISLCSIEVDSYSRAGTISPLITEHGKGGKCIVFTQTKRDADKLAYAMGKKFRCEALHGDISQSQRERTLSGFREGHFNVLVATDVAARGLDVPNVDLVIHYELPTSSETFVHRSGRTGRAGKKGTAILIHTRDQSRNVSIIERDVGCRFQQLPKIAVEGGDDMFSGYSGGSNFGGRSGGFGSGGFGRPGGNGGFGRSGGSGGGRFDNSGGFGGRSSGGYGGSSSNNSSGYGGRSSGGYGGSSSNNSSGYGGRSSGGYSSNQNSGKSGGFSSFGQKDKSW